MLEGLKILCTSVITRGLDDENALDVFYLADKYPNFFLRSHNICNYILTFLFNPRNKKWSTIVECVIILVFAI